MRKICAVLMMAALGCFAQETAAAAPAAVAAAEAKPIWILDGSNCECQTKHTTKTWFGEKAVFTKTEDGGFTFAGGTATRYLTFQPDKWLVFELTDVKPTTPKGYHAWSIHSHTHKCKFAGNVTNQPLGLYTIQLTDIPAKKWSSYTFYNYNLALSFKYIKMVDKPENYVGIELPEKKERLLVGDKFKVVLSLAEPCEDLTCKFLADTGSGPVAYAINGKDNIDLTPIDDTQKVWTADVTIQSLGKNCGKRAVMIKVTTLGSKFNKPIYTYIPVAFGPEPEKK